MTKPTEPPRDDQIDSLIDRIWQLAGAALQDHPRRQRAGEMIAAGGRLCARHDGAGRMSLFVGWLADPRARPADVDPQEVVKLVSVPRRVLFGGESGRGDS